MFQANCSIWWWARLVALAGLAPVLVLAGCGFQLRGSGMALEVPAVYLRGPAGNGTLIRLQQLLEQSGVQLQATPEQAWQLLLGREQEDVRTLTLTDRALTADYEIRLAVDYEIRDAQASVVSANRSVEVVRIYRLDPDNLAGSSRERELLRDEMELDLAQQILRHLAALTQRAES